MLKLTDAALLIVDVQGKLADLMFDREQLLGNLEKAIRGARALHIPVFWMEQNPTRMGPTLSRLSRWMEGIKPIPKMAFSCWDEPAFRQALKDSGRTQLLIAGIEAHVCVQQTAADLARNGCEPYIVEDAVSSRRLSNRLAGVEMAVAHGAKITTVEAFLFELMRTAEHPAFKEILKIVK